MTIYVVKESSDGDTFETFYDNEAAAEEHVSRSSMRASISKRKVHSTVPGYVDDPFENL